MKTPPELSDAALDGAERATLERFLDLAAKDLGADLHGIWLFGSRARGEAPGPDSDIDLLVVAEGGDRRHGRRMIELVFQAAADAGGDPIALSVHTFDPQRVEQRRQIRSFFIQEVDRDKIVLTGRG